MDFFKRFDIKLPYETYLIEKFTLKEKINNHVKVSVRAIVEEGKIEEYINKDISDEIVTINEYNERLERKVPIFKGKIEKVKMDYIGNVHYVEVVAVSLTKEFDIEKKYRSFMDLDATYSEVVGEVLQGYSKKDFIDEVTKNKKVDRFLLQYNETDWQFIKRIATHFNTVLLADAAANFGRFYVGLPSLNYDTVLHEKNYNIIKNIEEYDYFQGTSTSSILSQDFISWQVRSKKRLYLGEKVTYKNVKCYVTEVDIEYVKGEVKNYYHLKRESGVRTAFTYNDEIFGLSLPGEIKERKGTNVRVHFEIDKEYKSRPKNRYFNYALESSSWYCMPEEGSKIHVYFPKKDENEAMAVHAIRSTKEGGEFADKTSDPSVKSFSNTTGSEMKMDNSSMSFSPSPSSGVNVNLDDSGVVNISGGEISIDAGSNVEIGARNPPPKGEPLRPKVISMSAKESIEVLKGEQSIVIDEEAKILATFIKFTGEKKEAPTPSAAEIDKDIKAQVKAAGGMSDEDLIESINGGAKAELAAQRESASKKVGFGLLAIGTAIAAAALTVATAGAAAPLLAVAVAGAAVGVAEVAEGVSNYKKSLSGDTSKGFNFIRDGLLGGNEALYGAIKYGLVIANAATVVALGGPLLVKAISSGGKLATLLKGGSTHAAFNGAFDIIGDLIDDGKLNKGAMYYLKSTFASYLGFGITNKWLNCAKYGVRVLGEGTIDNLTQMFLGNKLDLKDMIFNYFGAGLGEAVGDLLGNIKRTGDPINVVTGSFYLNSIELKLPDIHKEFLIERNYESTNKRVGITGLGWIFKYESFVEVNKENNHVYMLCTDGHVEEFFKEKDAWINTRGGANRYRISFLDRDSQWKVYNNEDKETCIYNSRGRIVKVVDKNNNSIDIEYTGENIKSIKTKSGYSVYFVYENNKIIQIKDDLERTVNYRYEGDYLTDVVHLDQGITRYTYTENGYIESVTDQNGVKYTKNSYDAKGRVISQRYPNGDTCTINYDDDKGESRFYYKNNDAIEIYRYNEKNLITEQIFQDGSKINYEYDEYENRIYEKDRNGNIRRFQYDINCNLIKEIQENGLIIEHSYNEDNYIIKKSDNNGGERLYYYDKNYNLIEERTKIEVGSWQKTFYSYDVFGRVTKIVDSYGNSRSFIFEDKDKVIAEATTVKDAEGNIFQYAFDKVGRNTSIETSYGEVEFGYNRINHVTSIKDALGNITKKSYDKMGNLIRLTTANNYDEKTSSGKSYKYKYDFLDRLLECEDPLGNVNRNHLDTMGNIIKEVNANFYDRVTKDGIGIEYIYDKDNRKIKSVYPDGGIERFFYDSNSNLTKHVTPEYYNKETDDGEGYSYTYNESGRLKTIVNEKGTIEKSFNYDLYGNLIEEIDENRVKTLFKYDLLNNLIEKRTPIDREGEKVKYGLVLYSYDKNSNKIKESYAVDFVDEDGFTENYHNIEFFYDKNNRLIRVKDKTGAKAEYRYDQLNNKTFESFKINDDTDKTIHYIYDAAGKLVEKKEEIKTRFLAEESGKNVTWAIEKYGYDKNGNLTSVTTPEGFKKEYQYDEIDRLIYETHKDKKNGIYRKYRYSYDKEGNLIKVIDESLEESIEKAYIYDEKNRLTHFKNEEGNIARVFYDKNDRIEKIVKPEQYNEREDDGAGESYHYDLKGQVVKVEDAKGNIISEKSYDAKGNVLDEIDGLKRCVNYSYNLESLVKEVSLIKKNKKDINSSEKVVLQKFNYDARGNIIGIEDGNKNITSYKLDPWGRIKEIISDDATVELYDYDYAGNITKTTDANGNSIEYIFNSFNDVEKVIDQKGEVDYFRYDKEGNRVEHKNRLGNTINFGYNIDKNITFRKAFGKEETHSLYETFEYNKDGTLKQANANGFVYSYSYTKNKKLKAKSASGKNLLSYIYDKNGNTKEIKDITGKVTAYNYDVTDKVEKIITGEKTVAEYSYFKDGTIEEISYGNGVKTSYSYDEYKNITKLNTKTSMGESLIDYSYKYDNNGNLLEKLGSNDIYYGYDNRNRLISANYNGKKEEFIYDRVGNRLEKHTNNTVEKYAYNVKNQLVKLETSKTIVNYNYDKQGNLIKESHASKISQINRNNNAVGDTIYSYNLFNQTEKVITKEGNTLENRYDAEGLRHEIIENGNLTRFIFNKENILVELDKEDKPLNRLARGYEVVSSEAENAKFYYHTQDEQGSTVGISNEDGYFVNSYLYDAFGNILESKEEIHNRIRYTGQQFDPVTQQYYLRARFYNPVVGRFLQEDPYRGDGLNLYAYCRNNPVKYYDPSGYGLLKCGPKGDTQAKALKPGELKFKADEANKHFNKHGKEIMDALGKNEYNIKNYLGDANYVVQNGTYVLEINGFIKLLGGKGSAKYAFVGLDRVTGNITTFHVKTVSELIKKAQSLGFIK